MRLFLFVLILTVTTCQAITHRSFSMVYTSLENKFSTLNKSFKEQPKLWVRNQISGNNDIEEVNKQGTALIKLHTHEKRLYSITILIILIITAALMHLISSVHLQNKYYKNLYLKEIKRQEVQSKLQIVQTEPQKETNIFELTDINPLIVENILQSLAIFEREKKYLDTSASLAHLAKECGTNTSYLSKVINHYKQQNFASYVNDLRLNHAVELWQKHPKLRYKSIQGMANMSGFNTVQSFSKKFQEKYNISPTHFLKSLEENSKAG